MTLGGSDPVDDAALFELRSVVSVLAAQVGLGALLGHRYTVRNSTAYFSRRLPIAKAGDAGLNGRPGDIR